MRILSAMCALALLGVLASAEVRAQINSVVPNPAQLNESVIFRLAVVQPIPPGANDGCRYGIQTQTIVRNGTTIEVSYLLIDIPPELCPGIPPPGADISLGAFNTPGVYRVVARGRLQGQDIPAIEATFVVLGTVVSPISVPTLDLSFAALLTACLAIAAAIGLKIRRGM